MTPASSTAGGSCRRALLSVATVIAFAGAASIGANADSGACPVAGQRLLDVEVASDEAVLRQLKVRKGDALRLAFRSTPGPMGLVTLHGASGSGRLLLAGPDGTTGSFVADRSGEVTLRFATEGGWVGSFSVTCATADIAAGAVAEDGVTEGRVAARAWALDTATLAAPEPAHGQAPLHGKATAQQPSLPATDWLKLEGTRVETGDAPANFGVKLRLQPAITVGMAAQVAQPDSGALTPQVDQAWLVGPMTSLQLGHGLSLDARAAWGTSEAGAGAEATERRLLEARLANTQAFGAWRFSPSIMLNYEQEKRHVPDAAASPSTGAGSVGVRPEVAYRFDLGDKLYVEPSAMVGPIWGLPDPAAAAQRDMRLKAETGVTIGDANGAKVQVGGSVEEGGPNAANVWTGRLQLNVPLK
jgi:hypothetical protein